MLLSDPTTKKAASAKAETWCQETWRQEIFDIRPSFSDEGDTFIPKEMRISGAGPKAASHR
jgi:hypothetical protein